MNKRQWLRLVLFLLVAIGVTMIVINREHINVESIQVFVESLGPFGSLVFIAVYAAGTVLFVPGSVMTITGGVLFGPLWGTLYNLIGATIGATLAFLVARYVSADWVERKAGGWIKRVITGVDDEGWRFVAFTRLVPLFPFFLLNYALGLTRIKLSHYVLTTFICMTPAAFAFTWLGYAGREAATGSEGFITKGLLAIGLITAVIFIPHFVRRIRAQRA